MSDSGKYDSLAESIKAYTEADAVAVVILGGKIGSGFSCVIPVTRTEAVIRALREVADKMEEDFKKSASLESKPFENQ